MIRKMHLLKGHFTNPSFEIFHVICYEHPAQIKNAIEKPEIPMLVFMHPVFFLRLTHPHPWLYLDIIIHTFYIGIRVMNDVMFHIPHKAAAPKNIQRKGSY